MTLEMKIPVIEMKSPVERLTSETDHGEDEMSGLEDKMEELVYSFKDNNKRFLKWKCKVHDLWDVMKR